MCIKVSSVILFALAAYGTARRVPVSALACFGAIRVARAMVLGWIAGTGIAFADDANFRQIAPGVYAAIAPNEAPSPGNRGFVSNLGFIVGRSGVVAIGTGANEKAGRLMLESIHRLTRKPVVLAVNLQATPDHVLGNASFARRGIPILAHRETDRFMVYNCPNCIRNARSAIGDRRMGKASIVRPTRIVDASVVESAGGVDIEIRHDGHTFQPGSLVVVDRRSGIVFAGEVLSVDRVPDVRNADLETWRAVLERLAALPDGQVVPAHGAVSAPRVAACLASYLTDLSRKVGEIYERGVAMQDAAREAALPDYQGWQLYSTMHASNIHFTFLKAEARDLAH
ncbi:MAG TPA: MBL fold metallo-hydrolase [Rhodocyclaceae bacterium]|nr:MBL fold metallo-hydrolase [Rhodocyclaceae bacterium]HMV53769.1 MBL fold metallo-hydrolase [Rhodocyclaceae bacterium]HNH13596.1 MBL fold metallo-hydrolase [Rhodocyclaceae bacterium]HNH99126.1 MBL fold metallo-hydrolase [Rhodocyclaceae bacterium]